MDNPSPPRCLPNYDMKEITAGQVSSTKETSATTTTCCLGSNLADARRDTDAPKEEDSGSDNQRKQSDMRR